MMQSAVLVLSLALATAAIPSNAWASKPQVSSPPQGVRSGAWVPISNKLAFVPQPNNWTQPVVKSRLPNGKTVGVVHGYFVAKLDGDWWRLNFLPGPGLSLFGRVARIQLNNRLAVEVQREQPPPQPNSKIGTVQGYFVAKVDGRWWRLVSLSAPAWFPPGGRWVSISHKVAFVFQRALSLLRSEPNGKVGTAAGYFVAKIHGSWWVLDTMGPPTSVQTAVRTRGD